MTDAAFPVSVVIPLHNKARFIRATLESVFEQTLPASEIIVVDDQSTDDGPALVRAMAHPRLTLVTQANAGPGPARNRGVAAATTEWVAFLDGDDLWRPGHLAALSRLARQFPLAQGLATAFERWTPGSGAPSADDRSAPLDRIVDYFADAPTQEVMWTSCVAMRCKAFEASGGFGAFQPGEDFEYWARFALDHAIAVTSQRTAFYVTDADGLMHRARHAPAPDFALQPIFATLQGALDDPRHTDRHRAIADYRTTLLRRFMRHALYRANGREARHYARLLAASGTSVAPGMRLLSLVPDPLLKAGMAARTLARRRRRSLTR